MLKKLLTDFLLGRISVKSETKAIKVAIIKSVVGVKKKYF